MKPMFLFTDCDILSIYLIMMNMIKNQDIQERNK